MARKAKVSTAEQAERDARWAQIKAGIDAREAAWQAELAQRVMAHMDIRAAAAA